MKHLDTTSLRLRLLGVSLRVKIMGIVLGMVLLLGLWVTALTRNTLRRGLYRELETKGMSLAKDLADHTADFVLTGNVFAIHRMLIDARTNNREVRYILVLSPEGIPVGHTLSAPPSLDLLTANMLTAQATSHRITVSTTAGTIHDMAVPIVGGRAGTVRVGMSEDRVKREMRDVTRRLLLATLMASLTGVALATLLTGVLVRPIQDLVQVARAVGRGDYAQRATVYANDEIGQLAQDFNTMTSSLMQSHQDIKLKEEARTQLLQKVITAQEEERKRVARELHDGTSQSLTSLMVGLKVLESACPYGSGSEESCRALPQLAELRCQVAGILEEIHRLARELRPSSLDDLGLVEAVQRTGREYGEKFSIVVDCHCEGLDGQRLPHEVETALYRIIQEALTNVARHSGARNVSVLLERKATSLLAIVEDDGRGFDAREKVAPTSEGTSLGLFGMMERASLIGGLLTIESKAGSGTTVFVEIPLPEGNRYASA